MKRRTFLKTSATGAALFLIPGSVFQACSQSPPGVESPEELAAAFLNPPDTARPYTWWHWMNGNITREGITLDLEAMQKVGVGGFQIFQVGTGIPKGPVDYGSEKWAQLMQHAASEADRLGLEFAMHNCPGWSSTGGPWITPELSMQQVVWSETNVTGGSRVSLTLPKPYAKRDYYRDTYVLAFPTPAGDEQPWHDAIQSINSSGGAVNVDSLTNNDWAQGVDLAASDNQPRPFLEFAFREPFQARYVEIVGGGLPGGGPGDPANRFVTLEASDNGRQYRKVCDISPQSGFGDESMIYPATANFAPVQAAYFRLSFPGGSRVAAVKFSGTARLGDWPSKANYRHMPQFDTDQEANQWGQTPVDAPAIDPDAVVDISEHMDDQGRLDWDAPAGNWTILRLGHTTIGIENHPAPDGGGGLECDKYSAEAMNYHFDHMFGELLPYIKPLAAKGKAGAIIDSYEVGMQNWTPKFPEEFEQRRGYDPVAYLPAMTGRVVGSPEISDRFLYDVRRTDGDLMADYYYGGFADVCRKHDMIAYAEPYSGGPFKEMQIGSRMDSVMGEFWQGQENHTSIKLTASIAHINGSHIVGAESFTSVSKWQSYPYGLKALGDFMYTQGLNRYVFHRYAHQPHPTAKPGMTMGPWGWHFERTNTWFFKSTSWLRYVARCQHLLRQGQFVGDLLYFTGVDVPDRTRDTRALKPAIPRGYDFDHINPEAIVNRLSVKGGRIVLPDGTAYSVLVLPDTEQRVMTPEVLRKIRDLVQQGMWLLGPKPERSPGLTGYPDSADDFTEMADDLWGNLNGTTATERDYGKGKVFWGVAPGDVLAKKNVAPDFEWSARSGNAEINYIHKRVGDTEVYFVANRGTQPEDLVCRFRVDGKQPECWDAVTGEMTPAEVYDISDGQVQLPLRLEAAGSIFVVFRSPASGTQLQTVSRDGTTLAATALFPMRDQGAPATPENQSWLTTVLNYHKIPMPDPGDPPALAPAGSAGQQYFLWENGRYALQDNSGQSSALNVSGLTDPMEVTGPWRVTFPPDLGAPDEITLNHLMSLKEHPQDGVKYFSGTATYTNRFTVPSGAMGENKRLFLDLGRVEVIAEVLVNGQNLGIYWMPPFRIDITDAATSGQNDLEVRVTTLWPNRLIGDEHLPPENEYGDGGDDPRAVFSAGILKLPDWYLQGKPKPPGGRITFTTWHHWDADDPLLDGGFIGPVKLRTAQRLESEV